MTQQLNDLDEALRKCIELFPKKVRFRAQNAFSQLDRANRLLDSEREIASFCAITGEEEAAAALICALQYQRYPRASEVSYHDHTTKAAVIALIAAIRMQIGRGLNVLNVTVDWLKPEVTVGIPLVVQADHGRSASYLLTPVLPLDLHATRRGSDGEPGAPEDFSGELEELATTRGFNTIKSLVSNASKTRSKLLYASDSRLPESKARAADLAVRQREILTLIALTVIILQTDKHQAMAVRFIEILIPIVRRLPKSADQDGAAAAPKDAAPNSSRDG